MYPHKGNVIAVFLAGLLICSALIVGYFLWQTKQKTDMAKPSAPVTSTATTSETTPENQRKFLFHEESVTTQPDKFGKGTFKNQFVIFDTATKSKQVVGETILNEDRADSYRLYQDKYILTISPHGNLITPIDQNAPAVSFPSGYENSYVSPAGNKRVVTNFPRSSSAAVTLTVVNNVNNSQTTYPIQTKSLVPVFLGWSSDEKNVYYILIQTEVGDPGQPLYQLDTTTGKVTVIPRDPAIGRFTNLQIAMDSTNGIVYYAADNGLWSQKIDEAKAKSAVISGLNEKSKGYYRLLVPSSGNANQVALSDGQKLIIKNLTDGSETSVGNALPGGSIEPAAWKSDLLIFIQDKQGSNGTEKQNGYFIVADVYNLHDKTTTEFLSHKTFDMQSVGRFQFIDWLP